MEGVLPPPPPQAADKTDSMSTAVSCQVRLLRFTLNILLAFSIQKWTCIVVDPEVIVQVAEGDFSEPQYRRDHPLAPSHFVATQLSRRCYSCCHQPGTVCLRFRAPLPRR